MKEKWLPCPGHEATHMVSDVGNIMSIERDVPSCYGSTIRRKARILKLDTSSKYPRIQLRGSGPKISVHRLVAMAFIGPAPSEKSQVNHIDGVKTNNRSTNLEWVSCSDNIKHSFGMGLSVNKKGPNNPMSKRLFVYKDGGLLKECLSTRCAAEFLGTSTKVIDNHIRLHGGRFKGMVLSRHEFKIIP